MQKTSSIGAIIAALAQAQAKFPPIKRSQRVDFVTRTGVKVKYSYAPLAEILESCRKPLAENGLAITQFVTTDREGKISIETMLAHSSGEWLSEFFTIAGNPTDAQATGSLITYARRYTLSAMLGIAADEDDDAEAAMSAEVIPTELSTHWCQEHKTPFFRKGKMKGFAHLIGETGEWCNEEKTTSQDEPPRTLKTSALKDASIPDFKTPGDLANWWMKQGLTWLDIQGALGIKAVADIKDLHAASETLAKIKAARDTQKSKTEG